MKRLILAAILALACGAEDPESSLPDPSALYAISGTDVDCTGGVVWYTEPEVPPYLVQSCAWECINYDGRDVRRVEVTFRRDNEFATWERSFVAWQFGVCE